MKTIENHNTQTAEEKKVWQILESVCDPEIPVLSVIDLGIIREVKIYNEVQMPPSGGLGVFITPTYSGCPAMDAISIDIRLKLAEHGYKNVKINSVLSPAWTTDWMSEEGKQKLKAYGIAPPQYAANKIDREQPQVEYPQCHSRNTKLLSQFGSTACKALYQCQDCREPFDYFKCH
jgi:ring-1,2-phenylacetyl-CoA epoxidase subunit PaaD